MIVCSNMYMQFITDDSESTGLYLYSFVLLLLSQDLLSLCDSLIQRNAVHHVNVQNIKVSFIMSVKLFLSLVAFNSIKTFGIVLRSTKQGDDCAKKKFILASDAIQSVIKVPRRPRV